MALLKEEPAGSVKSLEELFAIAAAMEKEAATRYAEIAARMRQEGDPALAEVFERLSAEEQGHLDSIVHWSEKTKGQPPDFARIRWEAPETFDDEGVALAHPRLLSAYRALSMAVRNEERAFAFWTYVAAHAETPEIRQAAETMAHEELGHVATLRRERRQAFHAERRKEDANLQKQESVIGQADLERRLAELLESVAVEAPSPRRAHIEQMAEEARRNAADLDGSVLALGGAISAQTVPDDPVALAELLTERYLEAGDTLQDEDALHQVQAMAGSAIARLAWLRNDLPELQRSAE
ncbi:ferritin-like domain-containing protein [Microvirga guangxiensis]|uniref:Rubrerythrin n=1 Tax=Microvirga guangxiensis TaxID=549386 RepID=A0A1G5K0E3_9HYPH|nr:ferritin family protein [Microvirga guangxiensis]SCY94077.1 Rubrerythrin [Microvirga guangxiensis]